MAKRAFGLDVFIAQGVDLLRGRSGQRIPEVKQPQIAKHPLLKAAQDYVDAVSRHEAACATKGVYKGADDAGEEYRLMSESDIFVQIVQNINHGLAQERQRGISKASIARLVLSAAELKSFLQTPRATLYRAAETRFRNLDQTLPKSNVKVTQSRFVSEAEEQIKRDQSSGQINAAAPPSSAADVMKAYESLAAMAGRVHRSAAVHAAKREP